MHSSDKGPVINYPLVWGGGGKGENGGGHMVLRGEGNRRREGKSTTAEHKERIDCQ